ncbi:MAG: lysophospholipid acyltransferase family protein [Luminiphilus sp.]
MGWPKLGDNLPKNANPITRWIGRGTLRLWGWRINGEFPNRPKMVVALLPHSSNFDFILTIAVLWALGLRSTFMMKHTLFWFPLGAVLRRLGGIPVDRGSKQGLVEQMHRAFQTRSKLVLGITPEGTRRGVARLKQGFARIALASNVPVLPAILDYQNRTVRFAELIENCANVESIMQRVQVEALTGIPRISR